MCPFSNAALKKAVVELRLQQLDPIAKMRCIALVYPFANAPYTTVGKGPKLHQLRVLLETRRWGHCHKITLQHSDIHET